MKGFELVKREDYWDLYNEDGHKIASTLDGCNNKLSIKNCEAIANGYDLDELIKEEFTPSSKNKYGLDNWSNEMIYYSKESFIKGFLKALSILGDKKFTKEDMGRIMVYGYDKSTQNEYLSRIPFDEYIQSLQQTEFDVEIEMEYKQQLANGYKNQYENVVVPKLDAEGNLILKRIEK